MNRHQITRIIGGVLVVAMIGLAGCASRGGYDRYDRNYGYDRNDYCSMCGVVQDIDPVYSGPGQDTAALGTILGAVIGAAAGNQIGSGDGRKAATVGGAIAGGVIGHEIDQSNDGDRVWRISVRLDNGRYATVTQRDDPRVSVGDYVVVRNDHVYPR